MSSSACSTATDGPAVSVVDLGSTNGTLVDGHRVQHALLGDGSVVQIGGTRIVVHLIGSQPKIPHATPGPARPPQQPSYRPPDPEISEQADDRPEPASPQSPPSSGSDPRRQHWSG